MKSKAIVLTLTLSMSSVFLAESAYAQGGMSQLDFDRGAKKTKAVKQATEEVVQDKKSGLSQLSDNFKTKKAEEKEAKEEEAIQVLTTDSLVKEFQRDLEKSTDK